MLHVGICYKLLLSQELLQRPKDMEITGLHTLNGTCDWLQHYRWQVTDDHANSSNLVPSDDRLLGPFKKHLGDKQFVTHNREESCLKSSGLLPGFILWCMTNVSGSLVCPIFRVLGKKESC
jgi:hypothetical protein